MSVISTVGGQPTYNPQSLDLNTAYNAAYGVGYDKKVTGRPDDLAGTSAFALNFLQQQQQNAYELELWNLNNKYNSAAAQMNRFREAGLNPNLIYSQQQTASLPNSAAPIAAKSTNFKAQNKLQTASAIFDGIKSLFSSATQAYQSYKDFYDYTHYGMAEHELRNSLLQWQNDLQRLYYPAAQARANATEWFYGSGVPYGSPYANSVQAGIDSSIASTNASRASTEYTKGLTKLQPFQKANLIFQSALTRANVLKVNAETGRIGVDTKRLQEVISNINADTNVKNFMLKYVYPLDVKTKGIAEIALRNQNAWKELQARSWKFAHPWVDLDTGVPWLDNTIGFLGEEAGGILQFLPNIADALAN